MELSSTIITFSLTIISILLFAMAAITWLPIWRKRKSGSALGLFLTSFLLAIMVFIEAVQIICRFFENNGYRQPFAIVIGFIMLFVAVIQYALSRGYFNVVE